MLEVVIIAKNEAGNIEKCIQSAKKVSNQILLIDDFSDDDTAKIAENLGARVIKRKFDNFANQRNFANEKANAKWLLHLDSDEIITDELAKSILNAVRLDEDAIYKFGRKNYAFGHKLNHGILQKDEVIRLFPKNKAKFENLVHEKLTSDLPTLSLNGYLEHHTYKNWNEWLNKTNLYSDLWAKNAFLKGKKTNLFSAFSHAFFGFFKMFFIKKGFLDGKIGFVMCLNHSFYVFMKYLKLAELWYGGGELDESSPT